MRADCGNNDRYPVHCWCISLWINSWMYSVFSLSLSLWPLCWTEQVISSQSLLQSGETFLDLLVAADSTSVSVVHLLVVVFMHSLLCSVLCLWCKVKSCISCVIFITTCECGCGSMFGRIYLCLSCLCSNFWRWTAEVMSTMYSSWLHHSQFRCQECNRVITRS